MNKLSYESSVTRESTPNVNINGKNVKMCSWFLNVQCALHVINCRDNFDKEKYKCDQF